MTGSDGQEGRLNRKRSTIELAVERAGATPTGAMLLGSSVGAFAHDRPVGIARTAEWMDRQASGPWVAIATAVESSTGPEAVALVQGDRSTFYGRNHRSSGFTGSHWRDHFHASFKTGLSMLEEARVRPYELTVQHPTTDRNPWSRDLLGSLIEVLCHLGDERELRLRSVHLDFSCRPDDESASELAEEISASGTVGRPIVTVDVAPEDVGCPLPDPTLFSGLELKLIDLRHS